MDRVFRISFRIVLDLPYTVVLGAAFIKEHQSTISCREKEGLRRTPKSTWVHFSFHTTSSATSSKDVTAAWTAFCAIRRTADNDPNLEDPRHVIPKCLAEANKDSLDQVANHLRITCRIFKERRQSHAAIVHTSRKALRKEERRRQLVAAGATIARAETAPASANQPPSNLRLQRESPAPTQTETGNPTIMDGAVRENKGTLD